MALFGLLKDSKEPGGLTGREKAAILFSGISDFGAQMGGQEGGALDSTTKLIASRQAKAKEQAAMSSLLKVLGGGYQDGVGPQLAGPAGVAKAAPLDQVQIAPPVPMVTGYNPDAPSPMGGAFDVPVPRMNARAPSQTGYQLPQRVEPAQLGDPRANQALMAAWGGGVKNLGDLVSILDKGRTKVEVSNGVAYDPYGTKPGSRVGVNLDAVNGFMVDKNDPGQAGRFYGKAPVDGAEPVFDQERRQVGWRLSDGSFDAISQATEAAEGVKARYNTVTGQDQYGRPVTTTAASIAQRPLVGRSTADEAAARTTAEAGATAALGLPQAIQQATDALGLIDQVRSHPALGARTGMVGVLPAVPGTEGADFDAMAEQLKGKVFLDAYQSLKGAGAITEQEGKAATASIARLDRKQSKAGYLAALGELERVINSGVERMRQKAAGGRGGPAPAARPGAGGARWTPEEARAELARRRAAGQ